MPDTAIRADLQPFIAALRRFNRFYTRKFGILEDGYLNSPFSLTEAHILYELAHHDHLTATYLRLELGLNAGYMSRLLRGFQKRGLLEKRVSAQDARQQLLSLTPKGRTVFEELNAASGQSVATLLAKQTPEALKRLRHALDTMEVVLGGTLSTKEPYILRPHEPGDMGWVVHRHGVLYNQEYGWDEQFEALAAQVVVGFIQNFDPKRERCWVAEKDGKRVGSVFLMKKTETVAQLRLLLVESTARGLGIGKRLVQECTRFARQRGYTKIVLWTNSILGTARHIYQQEGYQLVHEAPHYLFGEGLIGQDWELIL